MPPGRWLTRANGLTLIRVLAAPTLALAIVEHWALAAGLLFWAAVASDFADGRVARRYGESSDLGALIDHAVDAGLVSLACAALAARGALTPVLAPLIAVAFVQYALDSRVLAARGLRASSLGRWNGIAYYAAVAIPVTRDALDLQWPPAALVQLVGWLLVATTVASIADRLRLLALRDRATS